MKNNYFLSDQYEENLSTLFTSLQKKYVLSKFSKLRSPSNYSSGHFEHHNLLISKFTKFQDFPIPRSLTKLPSNKKLKFMAIDIFSKILCITGDNIYSDPTEFPLLILTICKKIPRLRDELFAQLIKQTTSNTSSKSQILCYKLIYLCLSAFLPSTEMCLILFSHLSQTAKSSGFSGFETVPEISRNCFDKLRQQLCEEQKFVITDTIEIWSFLDTNKPLTLEVFLSDGSLVSLEVLPSYSLLFCIKKICRILKLGDYLSYYIGIKCFDKDMERDHFYHYTNITIYQFMNFFYEVCGKDEVKFVLLRYFFFSQYQMKKRDNFFMTSNRFSFFNNTSDTKGYINKGNDDERFLRRSYVERVSNDLLNLRLLYYQICYEFINEVDKGPFIFDDNIIVSRIIATILFVEKKGKEINLDEGEKPFLAYIPEYVVIEEVVENAIHHYDYLRDKLISEINEKKDANDGVVNLDKIRFEYIVELYKECLILYMSHIHYGMSCIRCRFRLPQQFKVKNNIEKEIKDDEEVDGLVRINEYKILFEKGYGRNERIVEMKVVDVDWLEIVDRKLKVVFKNDTYMYVVSRDAENIGKIISKYINLL